jgi:hypothetical protein
LALLRTSGHSIIQGFWVVVAAPLQLNKNDIVCNMFDGTKKEIYW